MMKKFLFAGILAAACLTASAEDNANSSGEFTPSGKMEGTVFTNFQSATTDDAREKHGNGFVFQRAYFGYKYQMTEKFKAHVRMDVGSMNGDQYAYFKTAALTYKEGNLTASAGVLGTYLFKYQEELWGKRYVAKQMNDIQKFGNSADLGITAEYKIENISIDFGIYNGEGYKKLEQDDDYLASIGVAGKFLDKKLIARVYADRSIGNVFESTTLNGFVGYDLGQFNIGAEYTIKQNHKNADGDDRSGMAAFAQYEVNDKIAVWGRYDQASHDSEKAESYLLGGVEYILVPKKIRASLNYQQTDVEAGDKTYGMVYLHMEFKF